MSPPLVPDVLHFSQENTGEMPSNRGGATQTQRLSRRVINPPSHRGVQPHRATSCSGGLTPNVGSVAADCGFMAHIQACGKLAVPRFPCLKFPAQFQPRFPNPRHTPPLPVEAPRKALCRIPSRR